MKPFALVKYTLYPFTLIYGAVVWLRNRLYNSGVYSEVSFDLPVINVGNLSTGGTGKTPHVEYLIRLLQYRYVVATMSRGYKRRTQGFLLANEESNAIKIGDEPMQYHLKFPEAVVSVCEDRVMGIPTLIQRRPDIDVLLLDDAFQHRSVKAGLNILITDHSKPYYQDHILPYGRLRESRSAAQRADVIIVSKCPKKLTAEEANTIQQHIKPTPQQQLFFSGIRYGMPYDMFTREPASYKGKHVLMVCGIAKPEPMLQELRQYAQDVHALTYADHHYFVHSDAEEIKSAYDNWQVADKVIVTTEKDATRLLLLREKLQEWNIPFLVLPIEVYFLFGAAPKFHQVVEEFIASYQTAGLPDLPDDMVFEEVL